MTIDLVWNAGEGETIGGVDLLGLRQVDQDLEAAWVGGVTTIARAAGALGRAPWTAPSTLASCAFVISHRRFSPVELRGS